MFERFFNPTTARAKRAGKVGERANNRRERQQNNNVAR
jgi:hypothetical protein